MKVDAYEIESIPYLEWGQNTSEAFVRIHPELLAGYNGNQARTFIRYTNRKYFKISANAMPVLDLNTNTLYDKNVWYPVQNKAVNLFFPSFSVFNYTPTTITGVEDIRYAYLYITYCDDTSLQIDSPKQYLYDSGLAASGSGVAIGQWCNIDDFSVSIQIADTEALDFNMVNVGTFSNKIFASFNYSIFYNSDVTKRKDIAIVRRDGVMVSPYFNEDDRIFFQAPCPDWYVGGVTRVIYSLII